MNFVVTKIKLKKVMGGLLPANAKEVKAAIDAIVNKSHPVETFAVITNVKILSLGMALHTRAPNLSIAAVIRSLHSDSRTKATTVAWYRSAYANNRIKFTKLIKVLP